MQGSINSNTIESLLRQHHKMMMSIAFNIVYDSEAAKDVAQDVFLKIWSRKNTIKADAITKSYLYRAVVNTSLDYLRKNKRIQKFEDGTIEQVSAKSERPDGIIELKELQEKIDDAIELLPPKCKTVFVLSRFENKRHREIAELLDISEKTVKNQITIALKKLHTDLDPYLTKEFLSIAISIGFSTLFHLFALSLLINTVYNFL